jgi:hypothetical protein
MSIEKTITIHYHNETFLDEKRSGEFEPISGQDKLKIAKQILFGMAIVFMFTLITCYFLPAEQSSALIEFSKTSFPPIVILIISFYFK